MKEIKEPTPKQVERYEKALAKRLKDMRDDRGLKRRWVGEQLGVHYNTIKNWELGNVRPGPKQILHLARIYDVEPEEFYVGVRP